MRLFPSQRGGQKLAHDGYIYTRDRAYETYSTWRCERFQWKVNRCYGRVELSDEHVTVTQEHDHSHLPDLSHVEATIAKVRFLYYIIYLF